jgi:hypothetical protein
MIIKNFDELKKIVGINPNTPIRLSPDYEESEIVTAIDFFNVLNEREYEDFSDEQDDDFDSFHAET